MYRFVAVAICALIATPAAAQSTTADGIRAVLRGDYPAALKILRPLADDASPPDPVAQFFLAILYDTGHGGGYGRACGLLLRAASSDNPFAEQSRSLALLLRNQLGNGASVLCVERESWQGGPPQSFILGPDHRIVFADTTVRVTYGDQEQSTTLLVTPGLTFLPIQYTRLTVTRPVPSRRHFFQWFGWMPDERMNPSSWTLTWALSEVVDEQWIGIAYEPSLDIAKGAAPPSRFDVSNLVKIRVNANGEAEFAILGGRSTRTEVIPPQGSR